MIRCKHEIKERDEKGRCRICRRKRRTALILLLIFIFLSLLYWIIGDIGTYIMVKRIEEFNEPHYILREVNTSYPIEKEVCSNRSFRFSTLGGRVDSINAYARPNLIIINMENLWGYFKVNFSFIEEEKFPYDIFGGENLKDSLATGKISYKDASFFSENYGFFLGPEETISITNRTKKLDPNKEYWAIANIIEPKILECTKRIDYVNITENKTFTEFKTIKKEIYVKEYRKIREIIGLDIIQWILILFLLVIIIFLLVAIIHKNRIRLSQNKR